MEIIDFHTHFYPEKIVDRAMKFGSSMLTPAIYGRRTDLINSMRENNIKYSVALPIVTNIENSANTNNWALSENHDEIVMLGSVHIDDPNYENTLEFIAKNNMRGIKLHPEYQDFYFNSPKMDRIYQKCIELNLFVLTHCGFDIAYKPPFHCTPAMLKDVHLRFPKLTLIGAHLGGMRDYEAVEKEIIGLPIYLDLAFMTPENIEPNLLYRLIKKHDINYILYGSDSPWGSQKEMIEIINSFDFTEEERAKIFYKNAERLLF